MMSNDFLQPILNQKTVIPFNILLALNSILSIRILIEIFKVLKDKRNTPIYLNWASKALTINIINFIFCCIFIIFNKDVRAISDNTSNILIVYRYIETIFWYLTILSSVYYLLFQSKFINEDVFEKSIKKSYILILHLCAAFTVFCFLINVYDFVRNLQLEKEKDFVGLIYSSRWLILVAVIMCAISISIKTIAKRASEIGKNIKVLLIMLFMIMLFIFLMAITRTLFSTYALVIMNTLYLFYMKKHIVDDKGRLLVDVQL